MGNEFINSKISKTCYHGTTSKPFTVLDKSKIQKEPEDGDSGYFGWGFYLTTDRRYAETFGDTVLEFKVNIENPFTFDLDDYSDLISYIFKDAGKKLHVRLQDTMYALHLIGENKQLEFKNNNSKELNAECLNIYNKYNKKELDDKAVEDIKQLMNKLAKNITNWLNGAFMMFGKELFHYFTFSGYDGIIALGGKEVVVYETKQLLPLTEEHVEEDLEVLDTIPLPMAWKERVPLVGRHIMNIENGKKGQIQTQANSTIQVLFDGNKHFTKFYFWNNFLTGEVTMTTTNDSVVTNKYVLLPEPQEVKFVNEEADLEIIETPHWEEGSEEYMNKIEQVLKNNPNVTSYKFHTKLYPSRKNPIWYDGEGILEFTYRGILEVYFYCGGDNEIWIGPGDDDLVYSAKELQEEYGIFTDAELYERTEDVDGAFDEDYGYFGIIFTPLDSNGEKIEDVYGYDIGYDDYFDLDDIIGYLDGWINDEAASFISDNQEEYWPEEEPNSDEESEEKSEETVEESLPVKKHVTREQLLKDIIRVFGYISVDNLTDAIYILPNGKILDTKGPNDKSQHENVAKYLSSKYNMKDMSKDNGSRFMDDIGAIRVTPWIPALVIPANALTEKQEHTLYDVLSKLSLKVNKDSPLMISNLDGSKFIEYKDLKNPEDAINSILGYQIFGILKESKRKK